MAPLTLEGYYMVPVSLAQRGILQKVGGGGLSGSLSLLKPTVLPEIRMEFPSFFKKLIVAHVILKKLEYLSLQLCLQLPIPREPMPSLPPQDSYLS